MRNFAAFCLACAITIAACTPTKVQAATNMHYSCSTTEYGSFPIVLQDDLAGWIQLDTQHNQPLTWSNVSAGAGILVSWSTTKGIAMIIFNARSGLGKMLFMGEMAAEDVINCTKATPL